MVGRLKGTKEVAQWVMRAKEINWSVTSTRGDRLCFKGPEEHQIAHIPTQFGHGRSLDNARAQLRRAGFVFEEDEERNTRRALAVVAPEAPEPPTEAQAANDVVDASEENTEVLTTFGVWYAAAVSFEAEAWTSTDDLHQDHEMWAAAKKVAPLTKIGLGRQLSSIPELREERRASGDKPQVRGWRGARLHSLLQTEEAPMAPIARPRSITPVTPLVAPPPAPVALVNEDTARAALEELQARARPATPPPAAALALAPVAAAPVAVAPVAVAPVAVAALSDVDPKTQRTIGRMCARLGAGADAKAWMELLTLAGLAGMSIEELLTELSAK